MPNYLFFRMACEIINRRDENTVYFSRCNKKKLRGETEGKAKKINEREEEKRAREREKMKKIERGTLAELPFL